ncbi:putative GPI-GlcNAc transferase complex [Echria macrotheca]|uniref:GPI-GlcNAc transferase complex n=1 Tax=Echria macrotheca TaxID=438768 RepID=A0AAJ0BNF4_9PEZI|nr:putative GPI-GlcNAc transferase complex [Echria macrotheca]
MLTTPPHLYIRRPSPTTAEFTVTTRPPLTLPLRLALTSLTVLRLLVAIITLFTLYIRFHALLLPPSSSFPSDLSPQQHHLYLWSLTTHHLERARLSPAGQFISTQITTNLPEWTHLALAMAVLYLSLTIPLHTTESLLVLRGLGIQTSTTTGNLLGGICWPWGMGGKEAKPATTRFIPTEKIRDVLINEAFRGFEVRYYLIVVVEGEEEVVVVFPRLLPRRKIVEAVWRGVRGCLHEAPMEGGGWYNGRDGHKN